MEYYIDNIIGGRIGEIEKYPAGKTNTSYTILEGITAISGEAFYGCESLIEIIIPESVKTIMHEAFSGCTSLTKMTIPEGVETIGFSAFYGCSTLKEIEIPEGVTRIDSSTFERCTSLTKVIIPSTVAEIREKSFLKCISLSDVVIKEGVTSIGSVAFYGCESLTQIIIPEGVKEIGGTAFYECTKLEKVEIAGTVENIGYRSFYGCANLSEIIILEGVKSINGYAFGKCTSLAKIIIPGSVTNIGESAFKSCTSLEEIVLIEGVNSIGKSAFAECTSLVEIKIPEGVTNIGEGAFEKCTNLTKATIASSVVSIQSRSFVECTKLTEIKILEGVTNIGESAFEKCISLAEIEIPNGVANIGNKAFRSTSVIEIEIPEGVTTIGASAFSECKSLVTVKIPSTVADTGASTFSGCTSLENVIIAKGVTTIGDSAFSGCNSLTTVKIPSSVTSIGGNAFSNCTSLDELEIPEGVTNIGDNAFNGAVVTCLIDDTTLELPYLLKRAQSSSDILYSEEGYSITGGSIVDNKIIIEEGKYYATITVKSGKLSGIIYLVSYNSWDISESRDGSIIAKLSENGELVIEGNGKMKRFGSSGATPWSPSSYSRKIKSIRILEGITNIGDHSFYSCQNLTKVIIPEGVTNIGDFAFYYCKNLSEIEIPEGVTVIGGQAFAGCASLTRINIPSTVTAIYASTFSGCSNLTEVKIPEGLTSIEMNAFYGCKNLRELILPMGVNRIGDNAFEGCENLTIICNKNSVAHEYAKNKELKYFAANNLFDDYILIEKTKVTYEAFKQDIDSNNVIYSITNEETGEELKDDSLINTNNILTIESKKYKLVTTWDISKNQDDSIKAILTLDGTLSISGEGEMQNWTSDANWDFHTNTNKNMIKKVKIKGKITSIGAYAFDNFTNLTYIEEGTAIKEICDYAFNNCSKLDFSLSSTKVLEKIGERAFYGSGITEGDIPYSVTKIGNKAFMNCTELSFVDISENVAEIGDYAFANCSNLDTVEIFSEKTTLGANVFWGNSNTIIISKANSDAHEYVKNSGNKYMAIPYKIEQEYVEGVKPKITYAQFKETIESNVSYHVYDYSKVDYNISDDTIIETDFILYIGNDVSVSREYTLIVDWDISEAQDGSIGAGLSKNGTLTISGTGTMKNWTGIDGTDYHTQENISKIQRIVIEDGVRNIGEYALYGIENISEVSLPKTVESVGAYAFENCSNLQKIIVNSSNATLCDDNGVLYSKDKTNLIRYPEGKEETVITIPRTVTNIQDDAFSNIEDIKIVTNRETAAVTYAIKKEIAYIAIAPEIINETVFIEDTELKYSTFKQTTQGELEYKIIDQDTGEQISDDTKLKTGHALIIGEKSYPIILAIWDISVNEDESIIARLLIEDKTLRITGTGEMKSWGTTSNVTPWEKAKSYITKVEMEESIINIGSAAFYGCNNLTIIDIPETINVIGTNAFASCTKLKEIEIPKNVEEIKGATFQSCTSLEEIILPEGVKSIGDLAFSGCGSLQKISIPEGVTKIGYAAFRNCRNLTQIVIPNTLEEIEHKVFENVKGPVKYYPGNNIMETYALDSNKETEFLKILPVRIAITKAPSKTEYYEGQDFDTTGMVVEVIYNDGTGRVITDYTVTGGKELQLYKGYVTIRYTENDETMTTLQEITVIEKPDIVINTYEEEQDDGVNYIVNIAEQTTIAEVLGNIETSGTIEVYEGTTLITDTETIIGTGMTIKIIFAGENIEYQAVVEGDLTGDGKMGDTDALRLARYKVGLDTTLTGAYLKATDINNDGREADDIDLLKMVRMLVGLDT